VTLVADVAAGAATLVADVAGAGTEAAVVGAAVVDSLEATWPCVSDPAGGLGAGAWVAVRMYLGLCHVKSL
jgi:hypothetical protein